MLDKIQSPLIDTSLAPIKGVISNSDYVFVRGANESIEKVLVSDLLAGTAGAVRIRGEADMDNASTTQTSIVIIGDPNNATMEQGVAPVDTSPNGVAYVVKTAQSGVQTQISGTVQTVFDGDQIIWSGSKWSILALGNAVTSVDGQTGDVDLESKYYWDSNKPTIGDVIGLQASLDNKYSPTNKPTPEEIGAINTDAPAAGVRNDTTSVTALDWNTSRPSYMKLITASKNSPTGGVTMHGFYMPHGAGFSGTFGTQFAARNSHFFFRSVENNELRPWRELYHTGNIPTAADVGALPSTYIPDWSVITNKPSFATRWPTYAEVAGKPTYFDTQWSQIDGIPTSFPSTWTTVSGKPTSFPTNWTDISGKPATFPATAHNHDDRYYTKTYIDSTFVETATASASFAPLNHNHDTLYYTKAQSNNNYKSASYVPAWSEITSKPSTATRWPTFTEVTSKPATATRWPTWSEVVGKPTTFVADWGDITNIPVYAKRWPTKAEVGLSNIPNYTISNATNDPSTNKFASTAAVYSVSQRVAMLESGGSIPVYKSNDPDNSDFPIGTTLIASVDGSPIYRNEQVYLFLEGGNYSFIASPNDDEYPDQLHGIWGARGYAGNGIQLFQRIM